MKETFRKEGGVFLDFCRDRRNLLLLYVLTVGLFLLVSFLSHLENASALFYSAVLTSFVWLCFGAADFVRYRQKRKQLQFAAQTPELAERILLDEGISHLERQYVALIGQLCRDRERILAENEQQREERNDYYLLWTHQIKTPIAAMKLLLEEEGNRFLMSQELFKIEEYAEMVLHYLRLESMSGDLLFQEIPLERLVKETVKKFSILFINGRISLQLGDFQDVTVLTDEKWLSFVLGQLLSNSIKYAPGGTISLYLSPEESMTLVVEDDGIGIRPEDLPRIFEKGFTGYNGRLDQKATGIGLYLSKQVLDHLGTAIRVESSVGKGTRVFLDLGRQDSTGDKNVSFPGEM